jgi:hypothetical protein
MYNQMSLLAQRSSVSLSVHAAKARILAVLLKFALRGERRACGAVGLSSNKEVMKLLDK